MRGECADAADDFSHRVFRAYFEQGLNIGDIAVLETIGAEAGIGSERIAESQVKTEGTLE